MKHRLAILFTILGIGKALFTLGQSNAEDFSVQVSAEVQLNPASITLNWKPNAGASAHHVYRKTKEAAAWGASIATLSAADSIYQDLGVVAGSSYEYRIYRPDLGGNHGNGYIHAGIEVPPDANKGIIILVVEDSIYQYLGMEVAALEADLKADSWFVERVEVNRADDVADVKAAIKTIYTLDPINVKAVYLLGHVPVPYSGDMNPDGHTDHLGAWPADVYYAEMNGTWTDVSINNTTATQSRHHNVPGDGKFDQSQLPGALELQSGRVDFNSMPVFADDEIELTRKYLEKAHKYKVGEIRSLNRGLVDQGSFTAMAEGFAQNGFKNFTPMFGTDSVHEVDYRTNLANGRPYMWSYGCGAGSYTSASQIGTSANFATDSLEGIFTMIFGSYHGDWDSDNNLMRAALGSGTVLSCSWAGRPNWMYHHMALGENLGYSAKITQNNNALYDPSSLGIFFRWTHIAQLGDPSLRMYYPLPPANLVVNNLAQNGNLSWTASADPAVIGYNIYRREMEIRSWTLLNPNPVVGTTYLDMSVASAGNFEYMVRAVELRETASGTFYNQSLGIFNSESFAVSINELHTTDFALYPNPTTGEFSIALAQNSSAESIEVTDLTGRTVHKKQINNARIIAVDLGKLPIGVYLVSASGPTGTSTKSLVRQ